MLTAAENQAVQRRAAYATLLPVLGQESAVGALDLLERTLKSDNVSHVIDYVDAVARRHRLDDATRRRLYANLFAQLRAPAARLPADPLAPEPNASAATPEATNEAPAAATAPHQFVQPQAPGAAEHVVFESMVLHLLEAVGSDHALAAAAVRLAALEEFSRAQVHPVTRELACAAWHQPHAHAWRISGAQATDLAELPHRLYRALCTVLGPVPADSLLLRAAAHASALPDAQTCPPGRLL